MAEYTVKKILANVKGGLTGVAVYLIAGAILFFIAFMTAFGNDTPEARGILQGISVYASLANPLWGIPLSYGAGAVLVKEKPAA